MNCTSCGNPLAPGAAFCPVCGASTPYNTSGQGSGSQNDPTEASPYGSAQSYPPLPPTVAASPDNYPPQAQNPYGNYTNYGASPQPPYNPYGATPAYGENPPPLPPANLMGAGPYYNQSPGYPPMQPGMYGTPPKKRSKVGLIIGISVLALVLLCGGILVAAVQLGKNAATTVKNSASTAIATTTNATTTTGNAPTSADVVPAAARILFGAQTSSAVDANYDPKNLTTTFVKGKDVALTFHVNSAGKNGYIKVKWYEDGQQVDSAFLSHKAKNNHVYFAETYLTAGNASAAIYWCTKANCSDEQLAQVISFTITEAAASVPSTHTSIAVNDWKRNND